MTMEMAGRLRHRVMLQRRDSASGDGGGGLTPAWRDVAIIAAAIEPITVHAVDLAARETAQAIYRVRVRYRPDIMSGMRLLWRGQALEIMTIQDPTTARVVLDLVCRSGAAP